MTCRNSLTNGQRGEFLVHTTSGSVYLVELNYETLGGFVTRSPLSENEVLPHDLSRKALVHIVSCQVGEPGSFAVEVAGKVVLFKTTVVKDIVDVTVKTEH